MQKVRKEFNDVKDKTGIIPIPLMRNEIVNPLQWTAYNIYEDVKKKEWGKIKNACKEFKNKKAVYELLCIYSALWKHAEMEYATEEESETFVEDFIWGIKVF